jgi:hypothetical protein
LRQQRTFATRGQRHKHRPSSVDNSVHASEPGDQNGITARRETYSTAGKRETSTVTVSVTPSNTKLPVVGSIFLNPRLRLFGLTSVVLFSVVIFFIHFVVELILNLLQ